MLTHRKQVAALYVDRSNQQWIAQDCEGNYWILPTSNNPWDDRQPFVTAEDTELEPVPGHYKFMLGLPH